MTDVQPPPTHGLEGEGASPVVVPDAEKPVTQLLADMTSKIDTLLRKQVEMAVVELKDEVRKAAKAGGMLGGAGLSGYLALLFASFGVAWFFDRKLPRWMAFFLVAALHGAAAANLLKGGAEEMSQVDPVPAQTVETLKESVEFVKEQAGSVP